MKKIKIKGHAALIAQTTEDKEYDALMDDNGDVYMKIIGIGDSTAGGSSKKKEAPEKEEKPKGRGRGSAEEDNGGGDEDWGKVEDILTDYDKGEVNDAKAASRLVNTGLVEEDAAKAIIAKMKKNTKFSIADALEELKEGAGGEGEGEDEGKSKRGSGRSRRGGEDDENNGSEDEDEKPIKGQPKGDVVKDASKLKVGDKIAVYWSKGEDKGWWEGAVEAKLRNGNINIAYDDGTEVELDEEVHTRIVRL